MESEHVSATYECEAVAEAHRKRCEQKGMNILEQLRKDGPLKASYRLYTAREVHNICCAILDESYLIRLGPCVPRQLEEKLERGYAQACNDQHRRICEIKKILKETLKEGGLDG